MTQPVPASEQVQPDADELTGRLRMAVLRLAQGLRAPAALHGLTPSRLAGMVTLSSRGPIRQGDLARELRITAASASRLVDVLAESGMVERVADPRDQRACLLALTDQGTRALADVRREGLAQLTTELTRLGAEQRAALERAVPALEELAEAIGDRSS